MTQTPKAKEEVERQNEIFFKIVNVVDENQNPASYLHIKINKENIDYRYEDYTDFEKILDEIKALYNMPIDLPETKAILKRELLIKIGKLLDTILYELGE